MFGWSSASSMQARCRRRRASSLAAMIFDISRLAMPGGKPVRTLERLDVVQKGEEIHILASARSILHNQVRSIVGSLEHVGSGKWSIMDMRAALDARDRRRCGVVAPPEGLYLAKVDSGPPPVV